MERPTAFHWQPRGNDCPSNTLQTLAQGLHQVNESVLNTKNKGIINPFVAPYKTICEVGPTAVIKLGKSDIMAVLGKLNPYYIDY